MPKFKQQPCNTNNIHLEQMKAVSEGRRVCVSLAVGEMRERESAAGILYLFS